MRTASSCIRRKLFYEDRFFDGYENYKIAEEKRDNKYIERYEKTIIVDMDASLSKITQTTKLNETRISVVTVLNKNVIARLMLITI